MVNVALRKRARQFGRLVRHSAITPRTGQPQKPVLTSNGELGLTFIGHSAFFLQTGGRSLLIDPNFAPWLFLLKRLRRPGLRIADLPPIDLVLVTHAHFDHLHRPSLRTIARATRRLRGEAPAIVIPHQVRDLVEDLGFSRIIELGWWEDHREDGISVTHVPSRHWGARIITDMHRGYGGYVVRSKHDTVYHAGDTAYFEGFREIGRRFSPKVAMLPIGAYHPPSYRAVHASPGDAVQAFQDLGARWMVPMHYGSFRLAHEPVHEPLELLEKEAKAAGVRDRVIVLPEGVTKFF